MKSKINY